MLERGPGIRHVPLLAAVAQGGGNAIRVVQTSTTLKERERQRDEDDERGRIMSKVCHLLVSAVPCTRLKVQTMLSSCLAVNVGVSIAVLITKILIM